MENKDRLYLDTVKGIAIFLMLWTHCIQYCAMGAFTSFDNGLYRAIYTFHMPLLMLVSGYLFFFSFRKRDLKTLLIHRTQGMLQPIVFSTILYNFLMNLAYMFLSGNGNFLNGNLLTGLPVLMWFLWSVLASSLAVGIACKVTDRAWLQGILLVAGAFFVALFPEDQHQLYMYPFFVTGFLWAKNKARFMRLFGKLKYAILVIFPLMVPHFNWTHYIYFTPVYGADYPNVVLLRVNLFRFLIGLAGSAFVLVLVDILFRLTVFRGRTPLLVKGLGKIGENSLQIYCLSVPLLSGYLPIVYEKLMQPFGYNVLAENWVVYNLLFTPLLAAAYSAGLYVLILLLRKWKVHGLIFGR